MATRNIEIGKTVELPEERKPKVRGFLEDKLWFIPWVVTSYILFKILRGKL